MPRPPSRRWRAVRPADIVVERPMADSGEGTLDAFASSVPGARRMPITVRGPVATRRDVVGAPARRHAVVELAATSGFTLLTRSSRSTRTRAGFGEAIAAALDAGAERLLLGLGGSASSDGGTAALTVLGAWFLDASGAPVPLGNRGLALLDRVDLRGSGRCRPAAPSSSAT